jgi:hypothetical protein
MTFVRAWLRLELIRRWRSLAGLAVLVALAGATVLAGVAGARREASALTRLATRVKPATVSVYSNTPGFDWATVRALQDVTALTTFLVDYTYRYTGFPDEVVGFPPTDAETLHNIETPVVYRGRMWDPRRADEVVVTRQFAERFHKDVGATLTLSLPTPRELAEGEGSGPDGAFTGPQPTMHVVGVVTGAFFSDEPGAAGFVQMSPGVVRHYAANIVGPDDKRNLFNFASALVRLRGGEAAIPAFRKELATAFPGASLEVIDNWDRYREAQRHIRFEARCLLAFAAAALIAALFLLGQTIARAAATSTDELRNLRASGLVPRQAAGAVASTLALTGALGAAGAVALAYVGSQIFPLGTADLLEPSPGLSADWTVFAAGSAVIVVLVAAAAFAASMAASAARRRSTVPKRSAVATAAARAGLPVPLVMGTRFALESSRGTTAVPVRPALLGSVAGVLGVVAAFTFAAGVSDSLDHPERFGQTVQLQSYLGADGQDYVPAAAITSAVRRVPAVTGINETKQGIAGAPGTTSTIVLYTHDPRPGSTPVALLSGRLPSTADEVALAPSSLATLGAQVGDRVELTGDRSTRTFTVTGLCLMPVGPRNDYTEGGFVLPAAYGTLFQSWKFHMLQASITPGADLRSVETQIADAIAAAVPQAAGYSMQPPDQPGSIVEVAQVRRLPLALGAFLAVLAIAAVGYGLTSAVRRRRQDLAVLRAVGMTQHQTRLILITQGTVLALVGLVFGIPLGLAVGRSVWRAVANSTPIVYSPPLTLTALVLLAVGALVAANLLAVWPARRAARLRVAQVLRAE